MGDSAEEKAQKSKANQRRESLATQMETRSQTAFNPGRTETEFTPISQGFQRNYEEANNQQTKDYGDMMTGYKDWRSGPVNDLVSSINNRKAPTFSFERVKPQQISAPGRTADTAHAMSGYRDFADTGGYSGQDVQELRARGMSPIRAAYGNTMMEMDRSRALGGAGGSPNYIAAASKAQRELPGQMADAATTVNAGLAQQIREGKLQGLAGMTGIDEAAYGREMNASLANQGADLQGQTSNQAAHLRVQELTEQGYSANVAQRIAAQELSRSGIDAQAGLYGTTPGRSAMFGNQALNAYGQRFSSEAATNNFGLGVIDASLRGTEAAGLDRTTPGWQTGLQIAGQFAPMIMGALPGPGPTSNANAQQGYQGRW